MNKYAAGTALTILGAILPMQGFAQQAATLEEIVVTARKRSENLLDVPVSVSAFTGAQLQSANILSLQELSDFTPGFIFKNSAATAGRANNPDIRIRGVRQQQTTPTKQVAALFWDGSYIGYGSTILPFYDLERVEILKGPQTAYFGRNTFTGAVNFIPREPGDEFSGNAEFSYSPSQHDGYLAVVSAGGPVTDKVGLRASAAHEREGGDFTYGDGTPLGQTDRSSISASLVLRPSDDLKLKLNGYYVDGDSTQQSIAVNFTVPAGACNRTVTGNYVNVITGAKTPFTRDMRNLTIGTFCGDFPRGDNLRTPIVRFPTVATAGSAAAVLSATQENALMAKYGMLPDPSGGFGSTFRTKRIQLSGNYDLATDHTLEFTTSMASTGVADAFDLNFGIAPGNVVLPAGNGNFLRELNYEIRLVSPQDQRLRYLAGVNKYSQRYRNGQHGTNLAVNFENNSTFSVYGSVDYDITDELTFSFEGRYLDDETLVLINGNPNDFNPLNVARNVENGLNKFIPRAILTYKPADGTTIYSSYSSSSLIGAQTGARRISVLDPVTVPDPTVFGDFTPPQKNVAWELGWKQQYERWAFTLAAYHMNWKNQIFSTSVQAGIATSSLSLPGSSRYNGLDFEVFADPTNWLVLQGGFTVTDAKLTKYSSRGSFEQVELGSGFLSVDASGNRPDSVPKFSGNLSATIQDDVFDRAWFARFDLHYEGSYFIDNFEYSKNKGAARFNVRSGIDVVPGTSFELYVSNLTNNKRLRSGSTTNTAGGRKTFGAGYEKREFGVRVVSSF